VRPTLREVLANSHIAAVAIVVLLVWSVSSGVPAVGRPLLAVVSYFGQMVAIHYNPSVYDVGDLSVFYWFSQISTITDFLEAVILFTAAWALSRWAYKMGMCRSLIECRARLARRNND
jgi:hypothetical protein